MLSIKQQIQQAQKTRSEQIKDIWYVDDCNNCKDPAVRGVYGKTYTACKHPWYCHHDNGSVQEVENSIAKINHDVWLHGFMCAYEREELKRLNARKFELVKECRRSLPPIKH